MQTIQRPEWLNKKIDIRRMDATRLLLREGGVRTVCEGAACPNIGECFAQKQATFLILGNTCTRDCRFCAIERGRPQAPDEDEPARVAEAALRLGLAHVVVTSVTRDDLADGGASVFAQTIRVLREKIPAAAVEVLIPDFAGSQEALECAAAAGPDIIGHNVETVPRLYPQVRPKADYRRSLEVLAAIKKLNNSIRTKSGLMLGLGEQEQEVLAVFSDLCRAGCDFLSIGQYLRPGRGHYPVAEYIPPSQFAMYRQEALRHGFARVSAGPYVRSSYGAEEYLSAE